MKLFFQRILREILETMDQRGRKSPNMCWVWGNSAAGKIQDRYA